MNTFVETDRFFLREILEKDVEGLFALDSDPEVHRYLGEHPVKNRQQVEEIIAYVRRQYEVNGIGRWAIIDKKSHEFVGWTGLKYEEEVRKEAPYYDLGYRLRREFWGRGIATETALASLEYGFRQMKLKKICAAAHVDNIGSNRVLSKVGMQLLSPFEFEGEMHNWYELDKSDWEKMRK